MEYSAWHSVIQDGNGAVVPMAKITVRNTSTGALAKLYSSRDGSAPKANPFNADENGQVFFFVAGGSYTVKAEFGSQERIWPFVPVGTAAEYDIDSLAQYLNSGVVYFQTYAALVAYLPLSFPSAGIVLDDPDPLKDGYYTNDGTGWVFGRTMPDTIAKLTITGGGVNTPATVVGSGVNPASPLVFYIDVATPNTGSVTLTVTGLGQGVVLNAAGNPLAAGEWQGRVMLTRESDGRFRIMNDPASALSAAHSATTAGLEKDAAIAANASAQAAKTSAETASSQAQTAKSGADAAKVAAETARDAAQAANSGAQSAKTAAEAAKDSAGQSAVSSASSASSASSSATTASTKASEAASSASSASGSAGTATTQANRAKTEADRAEAAATSVGNPVSVDPQELTPQQQAQARENIAAASKDQGTKADNAVRFNEAQSLTAPQQAQARGNISAASTDDLTILANAVDAALGEKLDKTGTAADSEMLNGKTEDQLPFLGVGQAWVDVTATRINDTVYVNNTGKAIMVSARSAGNGFPNAKITVDAEVVCQINNAASASDRGYSVTAIVPSGSNYSVFANLTRTIKEMR